MSKQPILDDAAESEHYAPSKAELAETLAKPPAVAVNADKITPIMIGVVLIGVTGLLIWFILHKINTPKPQPAAKTAIAMTVSAISPTLQILPHILSSNGSIMPWQEASVSAEVSGYKINQLLVDVGTQVQKGQVLATLSTDLIQAEISGKQAALALAQASQAQAESVLKRTHTLLNAGAISAEEIDRLKTEVVLAKTRVQAAQADLSATQLRLRYTKILAPDSGVITLRNATVGQIANAGVELFRLNRQARLEWHAEVAEADLAKIHTGQSVALKTADGSELQGSVRLIAPTVQTSNRMGTVYVDLGSNNAAKSGMFASGHFVLGSSTALTIPFASIVAQDGYSYVFVLKEDKNKILRVERKSVQIGTMQNGNIVVQSGLNPSDKVVLDGAGFISNGDAVRLASDTPSAQPAN